MNKIKLFLFNKTSAIPFILGFFIAMLVSNYDLLYTSFITLLSGSTFHITKSFLN